MNAMARRDSDRRTAMKSNGSSVAGTQCSRLPAYHHGAWRTTSDDASRSTKTSSANSRRLPNHAPHVRRS